MKLVPVLVATLSNVSHDAVMADLASLIVPAASALAGVLSSQAWLAWHEKVKWVRQTRHRTVEDRRAALSHLLVAINRAVDETRTHVSNLSVESPPTSLSREYHMRWNEAYERRLQLSLVLPAEARAIVLYHVRSAFEWREQAVKQAATVGPPISEDLIELLQPWITYQEDGKEVFRTTP